MFGREKNIKEKNKAAKDVVAAAFALVLLAGKPAYAETVPPYRTVGVDVVGTGSDPVADAIKPQADGRSKMELAMAEVARVDGMTPEESVAYRLAMRNVSNMKSTTVGEAGLRGKVIVMADGSKGGYNAQRVSVELPLDTKVRVGTYTYVRDGKTYEENFYVIEGCANPAVDAAEDRVVEVQKPVQAGEAKVCARPPLTELFSERRESTQGITIHGKKLHEFTAVWMPERISQNDRDAWNAILKNLKEDRYLIYANRDQCGVPREIICMVRIDGKWHRSDEPFEVTVGDRVRKYSHLTDQQKQEWFRTR